MNEKNFMDEYKQEAEKRIQEMEQPDYEFPESLSKIETAIAIIIVAVSGILLIVGRWL